MENGRILGVLDRLLFQKCARILEGQTECNESPFEGGHNDDE